MKIILSETQVKILKENIISEESKIYTDHDKIWNYRVINNKWETSKKSEPEKWYSLDDPKFESAVEKLDVKYPNARMSDITRFEPPPRINNITPNRTEMNLLHPLKGQGVVTSRFGKRNLNLEGTSTYHKGIDISVNSGTPVYSPEYGLVISAKDTTPNGCGGFVKIQHGDFSTKFCHLSNWVVKPGENVKRGQLIGYSGGGKNDKYKGISSGPHLHYEIRDKNNVALNPEKFHINFS